MLMFTAKKILIHTHRAQVNSSSSLQPFWKGHMKLTTAIIAAGSSGTKMESAGARQAGLTDY
jgi:hypothetical protein